MHDVVNKEPLTQDRWRVHAASDINTRESRGKVGMQRRRGQLPVRSKCGGVVLHSSAKQQRGLVITSHYCTYVVENADCAGRIISS